jgi:hypothetical protein
MSIVFGIHPLNGLIRDYEAQFCKPPQLPPAAGDPEPPAWLTSLLSSSGNLYYPLQSESLEALQHFSATLDARALNPQPLPPKDAMASDQTVDFGDEVALNPQPLPPKEDALIFNGSISAFGDEVALNPQPLPPRDFMSSNEALNLLDEVALNPQPLPPKENALIFNDSVSDFGDAVALNPQPLPPKPSPDPAPWQNLSLQLGRTWAIR